MAGFNADDCEPTVVTPMTDRDLICADEGSWIVSPSMPESLAEQLNMPSENAMTGWPTSTPQSG